METALTEHDVASKTALPMQGQVSSESAEEQGVSESADFLSFKLDSELYGVEINDVEEIRVWERPTPIPHAPEFVKGVINLRGMIVPVVDLRCRFGVGRSEYLPSTVVIVLRLKLDESERLMGLVVDAVSDVVSQGQNELYPSVGESLVTPYLQGLLNVGDQVMSLLNTEELLNIERVLGEGIMTMPQEFLSFILGEDEYGVPILDVREVRGWGAVREVPNSPTYMLGVLEIRGEYVPIVDLRARFGLPPAEISATTVVIVLNDAQMHPLGIIVDGVSEVYPLTDEQIKPAPHVSRSVDHSYIRGLASVENGHLILIKLEALFDVAELAELEHRDKSLA